MKGWGRWLQEDRVRWKGRGDRKKEGGERSAQRKGGVGKGKGEVKERLCITLPASFDPWSSPLCRLQTVVAGGARPKAGSRRGV